MSAEPFVISRPEFVGLLDDGHSGPLANAYAVAPIPFETGFAALAVALDDENGLDERQLELLAGIAGQAKMALTNAPLVREPRANVPLHRRGPRKCARGEG